MAVMLLLMDFMFSSSLFNRAKLDKFKYSLCKIMLIVLAKKENAFPKREEKTALGGKFGNFALQ